MTFARGRSYRFAAIVIAGGLISILSLEMASARCLAPGQWAWGSCGGGGRGGGGGGGGYGNYAAAAGFAIGALGVMIQAAEAAQQAEQNAANEAARRRAAFCNAKYKQSYALNEEAKMAFASDPQLAYDKFEAALANLGNCGTRTDLAKLRGNLERARASYAALMRPSEALGMTGGDAPTGPSQSADQLRAFAQQQCAHLEGGTGGWNLCMRRQMAQLIFAHDRDARLVCQRVANEDERLQCALNQYFAGLYGESRKQAGDSSNCYYDEHGKRCNGGKVLTTARPSPRDKESGMPRDTSFREELKKKIDAMPDTIDQSKIDQARDAEIARAKEVAASLPPDSPERKQLEQVIAKAEADRAAERSGRPAAQDGQKQAAADPKEQPKKDEPTEYGEDANRRRGAAEKKKQEDEALGNYAQSGTHSSQAKNDGKLDMRNPGAGLPNRGSFGNDFGGDQISGGHVPSNR